MRRYRERRRNGLRCLFIELRDTEVGELTRRGYLNAFDRDDDGAVAEALYAFLDRMLGDASTG